MIYDFLNQVAAASLMAMGGAVWFVCVPWFIQYAWRDARTYPTKKTRVIMRVLLCVAAYCWLMGSVLFFAAWIEGRLF